MERCPVCGVAVKAENLARHLQVNHPRDASAQELRENLRKEGRYASPRKASRPIRIRRTHVAAIAAIALLAVSAYVAAPYFDPYRNFSLDSCIAEGQTAYHIHFSLSIFIGGLREPIPYNVGVTNTCIRPIHTHDQGYDPQTQPAYVHVEAPIPQPFVLGDFFRIWGRTLTPTQVLGCTTGGTNVVTMTVNGATSTAFGTLALADGQQIEVSCGPSTIVRAPSA